jgi:hypothetical protein
MLPTDKVYDYDSHILTLVPSGKIQIQHSSGLIHSSNSDNYLNSSNIGFLPFGTVLQIAPRKGFKLVKQYNICNIYTNDLLIKLSAFGKIHCFAGFCYDLEVMTQWAKPLLMPVVKYLEFTSEEPRPVYHALPCLDELMNLLWAWSGDRLFDEEVARKYNKIHEVLNESSN